MERAPSHREKRTNERLTPAEAERGHSLRRYVNSALPLFSSFLQDTKQTTGGLWAYTRNRHQPPMGDEAAPLSPEHEQPSTPRRQYATAKSRPRR